MNHIQEFRQQLRAAITAAIAAGITVDEFTAEVTVEYAANSNDDAAKLIVHPEGYHNVPGCPHAVCSPLPLILGMNLTKRQVDTIRHNCCCNERGEWIVDGVPIPSFGTGFDALGGGPSSPVSWKAAVQVRRNEVSPESLDIGQPFKPRVVRIRGNSLQELSDNWAAYGA